MKKSKILMGAAAAVLAIAAFATTKATTKFVTFSGTFTRTGITGTLNLNTINYTTTQGSLKTLLLKTVGNTKIATLVTSVGHSKVYLKL